MPQYDLPTYPQFGHVYPGDYYEQIPYDDYIRPDQPLPTGMPVFDIRDFGAVPSPDLLNTASIRAAAAACEQAGGGVLLVTGGCYVTGTVFVPSNTVLFITPDAELRASRNVSELTQADDAASKERGTEAVGGALIMLKGKSNVTITGGGCINGQGEWFVYEPREFPIFEKASAVQVPRRDQKAIINLVPGTQRYLVRQRIRYCEDKYGEGKPNLLRPAGMVWVQDCSNVRIENIILRDSMSWTLHIDCCDRVTVRDLVIDDNRHVANADGIDVDGSADVLVEHCFISCSDDGLCVKNPAHTNRPTERITFRDCQVITVANSFKIGTETRHDIHDVLVENCHFFMSDIYPGSVGGISIESCDGSHVSNVTVRNITMDGVLAPLYILLNRRNRYGAAYSDNPDATAWWGGSIRNVLIENIHAVNAEQPSIITGFADQRPDGTPVRRPVQDISIRGFQAEYRPCGENVEVPDVIPEFLTDYPESNAHGDVDACGIWARHADGLSLSGIEITPRPCNTRPLVVIHE